MNKLTYASEYVDGLIADAEQAIALRDKRIADLESHNRACDDIIGRLVGQFGASGLHAIENSLNPAQALFYDALQVMKGRALPLPAAITDIIAERQRQQSVEGWTPKNDDIYKSGTLSTAAACYVARAFSTPAYKETIPQAWPWSPDWWKPTTPRRDLVKAGALIAAEIERIDRAAHQSEQLEGNAGEGSNE